MNEVTQLLGQVSSSYGLDKITAEKAFIAAPFGQKYFDECVRRLSASRALRRLTAENKALIVIVTSKQTKVRPIFGARIVQIDPIPGWPGHDRYQSRFIKWGIPFLFPGIRQSIYVDSDLHITNSPQRLLRLFELIGRYRCVITKHETRSGWEDECQGIITSKRAIDAHKIEDQRRIYQAEGLPPEGPVYQTNFVGRVHDSEFDTFSADVLSEILQHSERDQLALPRTIFHSGLNPYAADEGEFLYSGFKRRSDAGSLCFVDRMAAGRFFISPPGRNFQPSQDLSLQERALNKLFFVIGIPGL